MIITLFAQSKTGLLHYYTLHDRQLSLGQPYALTAAWRAENARERERLYVFSSARERDGKLKTLFRNSLRRGYRLLYSFDREGFGRFGLESAKEVGVYGREDAREG